MPEKPTGRGERKIPPLPEQPGRILHAPPPVPPLARVPAQGRRAMRTTLVRLAVVALALIASVWFISWAEGILVPLTFALFITIGLTPVVSALARAGMPRLLGAALVLVGLSLAVGVGVDRTRVGALQLLDSVPAAVTYLRHEIDATLSKPGSIANRLGMLLEVPAELTGQTHPGTTAPARSGAAAVVSGGLPEMVERTLARGTAQVFSGATELAAVLFLVYLMLAAGGRLRRRLARLPSMPAFIRLQVQPVFDQIERRIYRYLAVLLATNAALGIAIWGTFALLGMPHSAAWGVTAGIAHFVPYLGPAVIAVGSALIGALQSHSLAHGLAVGASSVAISTVIGIVIQTWLFGRSLRMNTVAVFTSLLVWAWLWGLPGMLLGIPIMMAIKVSCAKIAPLRWVDVLLGAHGTERGPVGRLRLLLRAARRGRSGRTVQKRRRAPRGRSPG